MLSNVVIIIHKISSKTVLVSAYPPIPLWYEKCVMMWISPYGKMIFPFVIVIFQTVSSTGFGISLYHGRKLFYKKCYSTSSHIYFFSQIRELNSDSYWCFDIFYYPAFFIHQNVRMDLTFMWVQLKFKH